VDLITITEERSRNILSQLERFPVESWSSRSECAVSMQVSDLTSSESMLATKQLRRAESGK